MRVPLAHPFCRPLMTDEQIESFVEGVLEISDSRKKRHAIKKIKTVEKDALDSLNRSTLSNQADWDHRYRDDPSKREKLRAQIVDELYTLERLDDDDSIRIKYGGAAPKIHKRDGIALLIIGLPASGKSNIINTVAEAYGAYVLDADYAKRKLPEFKNNLSGATLVHEESDALVFNYSNNKKEQINLLARCIEGKNNIVMPKVGQNVNSILNLAKILKHKGYSVYLISIDLDRQKATIRAYERFIKTKRYVPLSLIFDSYGNEPSLNYFKIKQLRALGWEVFSGFAQISTDCNNIGESILLEAEGFDKLSEIYGGLNKCKQLN